MEWKQQTNEKESHIKIIHRMDFDDGVVVLTLSLLLRVFQFIQYFKNRFGKDEFSTHNKNIYVVTHTHTRSWIVDERSRV